MSTLVKLKLNMLKFSISPETIDASYKYNIQVLLDAYNFYKCCNCKDDTTRAWLLDQQMKLLNNLYSLGIKPHKVRDLINIYNQTGIILDDYIHYKITISDLL
jgi:hypothetical protein